MRFLLLLDLCLFAILQSATSQECKVGADISGTNLVLDVTNICSCYKPEVGDPPTGGEPSTISKCDVVAVKNEDGVLSISLPDLCSAECKSESTRIRTLSTETVLVAVSTNTTATKDSPPVPESPSPSKLLTNITTTSSTPVPADLALNKTTTSTPTETLNVSSSSTTLSTNVSVITDPPLNTSTTTIAPDLTVSSTKTSTTTLPITNKPSTNSTTTTTTTTTTTPTSVPDPISSETPTKEIKSSPTLPTSHVHTSNETVTKAPPHSDEIKTVDDNANGSSTSKIVLFFFIGAVVGVLLVLVGSYVSKKYKSRAYEPREPAP